MKVLSRNTDNDILFKSFLYRNYFRYWNQEIKDETRSLEIIINDICDHDCTYCYFTKYGSNFFTKESRDPKNIVNNFKLLLDWLDENNYKPNHLDPFSSEIFTQDVGFDVLELCLERLDNVPDIAVPTNMSFIFDDKKTKRVQDLIDLSKLKGKNLYLSASVDGLYMEENRPMSNGKKRDSIYYDKLFSFCKKNHVGFHPMIYSKNIEKWIDNFLWFQEKFKEYNIPSDALYLLEVRNSNWSLDDCKELFKFMKFLVNWVWEYSHKDVKNFFNFIYNKRGFNIIMNPFGQIGRGIGCSIQNTVMVKLGDLTIVPCHRTAYSQFNGGHFNIENNKITDIISENVVTYINMKTFDHVTQPYCETCMIKYLCSGGCLGAQFEVTGDIFIPIPSVCQMEHWKLMGLIQGFKEIGVFTNFKSKLTKEQKTTLNIVEGLWNI